MTGQGVTLQQSTQVYGTDGREILLGEAVGGGGEAHIYEVLDDPGLVAKIYRKDGEERRLKLEAMLRSAPVDPQRKRNRFSICWPEEILNDGSGGLVGFLMPSLDVKVFRPAALYWNAEDRGRLAPGFTWRHLCVSAANIASILDLIHSKGHVVGDLNDENFLVSDRGLASIVDCDSMQIADRDTSNIFRSPVAREPYISPQLLGQSLKDIDRSPQDDCWALGILIFALLLEGHHPCNGVGIPEERARRIKAGIFPFLGHAGFTLPQYALPLTLLPPNIRALFHRCLYDGHADPSKRPTAVEWKHELSDLTGALLQCAQFATHWYSGHLSSCPWCAEKEGLGIDRFPALIHVTPPTTQTAIPANPSNTGTPKPLPNPWRWFWFAAGVVALALIVIISAQKPASSYAPADLLSPTDTARTQAGVDSATRSARPAGAAAPTSSSYSNDLSFNPSSSSTQPANDSAPASTGIAAQDAPNTQATQQAQSTPLENPQPAVPSGRVYQDAQLTFRYPSTWSVLEAQNGVVFACQSNATQRLEDGTIWCNYSLRIVYGSRDQVNLDFMKNLMGYNATTANFSGGKLEPQQTRWGTAQFGSFQGDTRFQYTEYNNIWLISAPNVNASIQISAPLSYWSAALPIFNDILSSLQFQ